MANKVDKDSSVQHIGICRYAWRAYTLRGSLPFWKKNMRPYGGEDIESWVDLYPRGRFQTRKNKRSNQTSTKKKKGCVSVPDFHQVRLCARFVNTLHCRNSQTGRSWDAIKYQLHMYCRSRSTLFYSLHTWPINHKYGRPLQDPYSKEIYMLISYFTQE
jgi:hypothetical protein